MSQQSLQNYRNDWNMQHGLWQDGYNMLNNNFNAAQDAESASNSQQQQNYNNLVTLITTTGYVPDEETLAAAGMTSEEAAAWKAYYDKQNPSNNQGGGTGAGSGYTANPGWTEEEIKEFQTEHNIQVDGEWGPETAGAYDDDSDWQPDGNVGGGGPENPGETPPGPYIDHSGLSEAALNFLATQVPAAAATNEWKRVVAQRLANSGLSDDEKDLIAYQLGLYGLLEG